MKKIAIFGGSFDPVHKGHEFIINYLSKQFDKVLVVPSFISPFKIGAETAEAKHRINMLNLAVVKNNVEICDCEIKKGGISYSYETAALIKKEFAEYELFFVIGSDLLNKLDTWKYFNELKELVTFYILGREDFSVKDAEVARLKKTGAKIEVNNIVIEDISSSLARVSVAFSKTDCLSEKVLEYIKNNSLYTKYNSIYRGFSYFGLKNERTEHTYRVVKTGIMLAKRYNINVEKAILSTLLHDIGKNATEEMLKAYGIILPEEIKKLPVKIIHAQVGALIAKTCYNIEDEEILDAITNHTTGDENMSPLAKLVYIADYIEEGRSFDGVEALRNAAKVSLDYCLYRCLENSINNIKSKNNEVYYKTTRAYNFYKNLNKNTEMK